MKKIALLTVFVLLVTMFSIAPVATAEEVDENALLFLKQMNITEGIDVTHDRFLSRSEFVAMVIRAMNMQDINMSGDVFEDVADNPYASEIYLAKAMGITNGTSETTFSPEGMVTFEAAAKMLVTVLGHERVAESKGGFPVGYMLVAKNLGLLKKVHQTSSAVDALNACRMIYNALNAELAVVREVSGENVVLDRGEGTCILSEYFDLRLAEGIITTAGTYTVNSNITDDGVIEINGLVLNSAIDAEEYIGCEAKVWYDAGEELAYAVFPSERNSFVEIQADDIEKYSNYTLSAYDEDGDREEYRFEKSFTFILNGRGCSDVDSNIKIDAGTLKLIDNDGDGKYEFVLAHSAEYFIIRSVNVATKTIYDSNSTVKSVCLKEDNDVDFKIIVDGEESDFSALKKGMVCHIYMSEKGDRREVVASSISVMAMKPESIMEDDGSTIIECDGAEFKINSYFVNRKHKLQLGIMYDFFVAPDGTITDISDIISGELSYGYFVGYEPGGIRSPQVKIFTAGEEMEILKLADKVKLDGVSMKNDDARIETALMNGTYPKYQLIKYLSKDGEVSAIDTSSDISGIDSWKTPGKIGDKDNSLLKYNSKITITYKSGTKSALPNVPFNKALLIAVPKGLATATEPTRYDDAEFSLLDYTKFVDNRQFTADVYDYDENYMPEVVVLYDNTGAGQATSLTGNEIPYIVQKVRTAIDEYGDETTLIKAYGNGLYEDLYVDSSIQGLESLAKSLTAGDVIRFSKNKKGLIVGLSQDLDFNDTDNTITIGGTDKGSNQPYYVGRALTATTESLSMIIEAADNTSTLGVGNFLYTCCKPGITKYTVFDASTGEAYVGTYEDITTSNWDNISSASLVAGRMNYSENTYIYIYLVE